MNPDSNRVSDSREGPMGAGPTTELHESPTLAVRLRRRLNYSLLGLVALAIPLGVLVAYGSYGFRLAFGQFSTWVHGVGRISTGLSQLLLLALGGLLFGLILKVLGWERFRGPANVIVAVHERDGRLNVRDGVVTAACDALALGMGASVGRARGDRGFLSGSVDRAHSVWPARAVGLRRGGRDLGFLQRADRRRHLCPRGHHRSLLAARLRSHNGGLGGRGRSDALPRF